MAVIIADGRTLVSMSWDAIVLAGGAGRRLGGVDKPALRIDGRSLLDTALAASAGALVTVVGPRRRTAAQRALRWVQESPAGSGPLAALAAGVAELMTAAREPTATGTRASVRHARSELVVVLAADLPALDASVVRRLVTAPEAGRDVEGAMGVDGAGRAQPLLAAYRHGPLERALAAVGDPRNRSLRSILEHLRTAELVDPGAAADIDTPEDLARWPEAEEREEQRARLPRRDLRRRQADPLLRLPFFRSGHAMRPGALPGDP